MNNRGALYIVWGDQAEKPLARSGQSLRRWHPELPVEIVRLEKGDLLDKAKMFDLSPFETTLFLDADTVVLGELTFAFQKAEEHGIACCICENPWARRYLSLDGDQIEYNTGVIAFARETAQETEWLPQTIFDFWKANVRAIDSSIRFMGPGNQPATMSFNDQAGFAKAIATTSFNPYVLPLNWNFRPMWHKSFWGPLKIWHDYRDVPQGILDWNKEQSREGAIIQYVELR